MRRVLVGFVVVFLVAAAASAQQPTRLTILHTSEHHGSFLPFDIPGAKGVSLAPNDFLAAGGDGYAVFRAARQVRDTQLVLSDLFVELVRRLGTVSAKVEGRITSR